MSTVIKKQGPVIAIDGPAGTGKSSATLALCHRLGFTHIDTGALYRAIGYLCLERAGGLEIITPELAESVAHDAHLEFHRVEGLTPPNRVFANGTDVTVHIRTPEVSMASSRVSAVPGVRAALLGFQRRLGCAGRTVLEGRDIGTVIFPDADVKFFLTASLEKRADRRWAELSRKPEGPGISFEELKGQIAARDQGDSDRKIAPMRKAEDAIEIDTSELTLDQVIDQMEKEVRLRISDQ